MFCLSKSFLRVIRRFLRSYPLQMTCGGDVHYSADKCLKGSVSEANCVVVWACEALEGLWGLKRYIVVPKVYPSGWWVTAASAANGFTKLNTTIFHPYLARGFGDHMLVFCLHLPCVLRVPISMQPLLKTWQARATWAWGAFSPSFQKWTGREQTSQDAVIYLCEKKKKKSSIFSLCYCFSVSITWLSW